MISDPAALADEIQNPDTAAERLLEIASSFPEFGPLVAEHPNASRDVLSYLLKHGDEQTRKAAARRRARDVAQITAGLTAQENAAESQPATESETESAVEPQADENATAKVEPLGGPRFPAPPDSGAGSFSAQTLAGTSADDEPPLDETRIAQRALVQRWKLTIEEHGDVHLSHTDVVIGRKPTPRPEYPDAQPITIPDPTKTVSKTHARLYLRGEDWVIVDLESTNGVYVETPRGEVQVVSGSEIVLQAGFALGDLRLRVVPGD